jgi:hypothetical protein
MQELVCNRLGPRCFCRLQLALSRLGRIKNPLRLSSRRHIQTLMMKRHEQVWGSAVGKSMVPCDRRLGKVSLELLFSNNPSFLLTRDRMSCKSGPDQATMPRNVASKVIAQIEVANTHHPASSA